MFGKFLLSKNLITDAELEEALAAQPFSKRKVGRVLVELSMISQEECDQALSEYLEVKQEDHLLALVADKLMHSKVQVVSASGCIGFLMLIESPKLFLDKFSDRLVEMTEKIASSFEVRLTSAEQWELLTAISLKEDAHTPSTSAQFDAMPVRALSSTPYRDMLISLLDRAKAVNASDVHFDSTLEGLVIRFRVNGDLAAVKSVKREHSQSFLTEVKSQTGLPLTVIGAPCSGAARFPSLNLRVRAQSNGQIHGETIVLRIIDEERTKNASIGSIGADALFEKDLRTAMNYSNGLILMCGQTGSGKSWTLYSLLMSLDRQTSKVITIEDPVEYEGPGLMQIEVTEGKVSFQDALRSSLRLDPDVIMVGEIRDEETAELAFKAASTGHLVFSTLHTNGALEALVRLKGLGIDDDVIASNVRLVSALTLRKRLCPACRIPLDPTEAAAMSAELGALAFSGAELFRRNVEGCNSPGCHQGAIGRTLLVESVTQENIREAREGYLVPGFRSLKQCALEMAASGAIAAEEALYA